MPMFFDKNNLTDEQAARWDGAVRDYNAVMESNLIGVTNKRQEALMRLLWNEAGHEKSALFARLLDGKAPLDVAPPTRYSYPWYDLIELDIDHPVDPTFYKNNVTIFQSVYRLISANKAAKALVSHYRRHIKPLAKLERPLNRHQRRKITALLAKGPEFILGNKTYTFKVTYKAHSHHHFGQRRRYLPKHQYDSAFVGGDARIVPVHDDRNTAKESYIKKLKEYEDRKQQGDEAYFKDVKNGKMLARFDNIKPELKTDEEFYKDSFVNGYPSGFVMRLIKED